MPCFIYYPYDCVYYLYDCVFGNWLLNFYEPYFPICKMEVIRFNSGFFCFFFFQLKYSCFTMLCQFLLYDEVNQSYVYTYSLLLGYTFFSHLSGSSQSTELKLPVLYSSFLLAVYFIHNSVYMSTVISQFVPSFLSPPVSTCPFSMSVSLFLPQKQVHLYHFSRFHIHSLIYDICFSLSDLLNSV